MPFTSPLVAHRAATLWSGRYSMSQPMAKIVGEEVTD
jgi:hypothetical protein